MTNYIQAMDDPNHPYRTEAVRLLADFAIGEKVTVEDGVVRWVPSGNVPPQEILDLWEFVGFDFDMEATQAAHSADLDAFIAEYREARKDGPSDEERAMARAAHGAGVELVDVISGHRWTT